MTDGGFIDRTVNCIPAAFYGTSPYSVQHKLEEKRIIQMSKAVVKKASTEVAIAEESPDWMSKDAGSGLDKFDASDIEIPRLVLLQSLSPQVTDGDEQPGVFYHSVLEEALGSEIRIVPICLTKAYILWKPRHEGGGILARADDGIHWKPSEGEFTVKPIDKSNITAVWKLKPTVAESGLGEFGSSNPDDPDSQPAATKMINIICLLPDHPDLGPVAITLQRGGMKVAKKLIGKLKLVQAPPYGQVFIVKPDQVDDGSGVYYNFSFARAGFVTDKKQYAYYKEMNKNFEEMGVKVKEDDGQSGADEDGPIDI